MHPKVINLSSSCVLYTQARCLNKGLKFTAIPKTSTNEMEKDIHNFTPKIN